MKKKCYILALVVSSCFILFSCNKTKRFSNRLGGYKWEIIEMTAEGKADTSLPVILFKDCDIYKESCSGTWQTPSGGRSQIYWQFRNKGKEFEISNKTDHVHSVNDVKSAEQNIRYNGIYDVIESRRKRITIKSTATNGFPGKEVIIKMERKD